MMKDKLKMNIQLFGEEDTVDPEPPVDPVGGTEPPAEPKTFSQEEVDALIGTAKKTLKRKLENESAEAVRKAKEQAAADAQLSADELAAKEKQRKEEEFAEREAKLARRELSADVYTFMGENDLPKEMFPVFESSLSSREQFEESSAAILASFNKAVEAKVKERLAHSSEVPGGASGGQPSNSNPWDKASFNLTEQGRIIKEDPDRAKLLQQQAK